MRRRLVDRAPLTALGLLWPRDGGVAHRRGPTAEAAAAAGPGFRLVSSNALKTNRQPLDWARSVLALEPDVLAVVELTPALEHALEDAGVAEQLPHRVARASVSSSGSGLWSRAPLAGAEVVDADYPTALARVPDLGVTIAAIHTVAPATRRKGVRWWRSFGAVAELAARVEGPFVAIGDWNATLGHGPLRELLAGSGLRDGHVDVGRRDARTWHARFPVACIDRVLVTDDVAVGSITEHRVPGSDHRALAAELAVAG